MGGEPNHDRANNAEPLWAALAEIEAAREEQAGGELQEEEAA